ncbi:ubiquitin-like superfamily protein [Striga asiatica]|uniref:Ubiquitin-like superfamily protein n=1 Tax=Striga asiatica TaxID=4170 RepID=A0A5A7QMH6_STRAF|nr:ubiquitin-like superfamily protein [Striga asiatica]
MCFSLSAVFNIHLHRRIGIGSPSSTSSFSLASKEKTNKLLCLFIKSFSIVSMEAQKSEIHQVLVKLLDGKHRILNFAAPSITVAALKRRIQTLTSIPSDLHLLLFEGSRVLRDHQTLNLDRSRENFRLLETLDRGVGDSGNFPVSVNLLLRLRGGKGGFGSLLRGAATKAGQKKTNNFDACRDMSGRRLRHVNAEKKLEEWKAEAEERKLEKMAEEFIKKKTKEAMKGGKGGGGSSTDKYVAKYREDSAKCMEEVERSVRESVKGLVSSKRKGSTEGGGSDSSKRLKIWYGKRKLGESDSEDDSDEEDKGEDEKSVIIDTANHSDSIKKGDQSSGSVSDEKPHQDLSHSGSEEEETTIGRLGEESFEQDKNTEVCVHDDDGDTDNKLPDDTHNESRQEINDGLLPGGSGSDENVFFAAKVSNSTITEPVQMEAAVLVSVEVGDIDKPLNFDEYHSAAELEVLGMERLKTELQVRGLKCGGTLQERAARLFLLKTTPLEMLPKKLFAKK